MYPWEFLSFICHVTHMHFKVRVTQKNEPLYIQLGLLLPLWLDPIFKCEEKEEYLEEVADIEG